MSVPVLMYHHVLPESSFIAIGEKEFKLQMAFLAARYKTLTLDEFIAFKSDKLIPPKKSVLITFDDGWRDNYIYAYPILKYYNLNAVIFVVTEWIEKASNKIMDFEPLKHTDCKKLIQTAPGKVLLNWNELKIMSDIFDIGSHTHTHRDFYFSKIGWSDEFGLSKAVLKNRLGISTKTICWPRGEYNENLVALARKYGFKYFFTTKRGINLANGCRDIKRIAVKKDDRWLKKALKIFSNNILGTLYSKVKP